MPPQDEPAVSINGAVKTYGGFRAVDQLTMTVPRGGVHGFLGPNGSGKTTTIRLLVGLSHPDAGVLKIFGEPVPERLPQVVNRVGVIVESPRFFDNFSGHKNLDLLAQAIGAPRQRVGQVLDQVGLGSCGKQTFRTYSLGMKQRLAVAATLLKDPELLIFDEPTNGLDPQGIHEFRATVRRLADAGRSVLVSSHILAEVQQMADTATIIGRGRTLAEGTVRDLLASGPAPVLVRLRDTARAAGVIESVGLQVTQDPTGALLVSHGEREVDPAGIARLLGEHGLWPSELAVHRRNLEDTYLSLVRAAESAQQPARDAGRAA